MKKILRKIYAVIVLITAGMIPVSVIGVLWGDFSIWWRILATCWFLCCCFSWMLKYRKENKESTSIGKGLVYKDYGVDITPKKSKFQQRLDDYMNQQKESK